MSARKGDGPHDSSSPCRAGYWMLPWWLWTGAVESKELAFSSVKRRACLQKCLPGMWCFSTCSALKLSWKNFFWLCSVICRLSSSKHFLHLNLREIGVNLLFPNYQPLLSISWPEFWGPQWQCLGDIRNLPLPPHLLTTHDNPSMFGDWIPHRDTSFYNQAHSFNLEASPKTTEGQDLRDDRAQSHFLAALASLLFIHSAIEPLLWAWNSAQPGVQLWKHLLS